MQAVGCSPPIDFYDYINIRKHMYFSIFENSSDEKALPRNYFKKAYKRGERLNSVDSEHNPVKNTCATKYTPHWNARCLRQRHTRQRAAGDISKLPFLRQEFKQCEQLRICLYLIYEDQQLFKYFYQIKITAMKTTLFS